MSTLLKWLILWRNLGWEDMHDNVGSGHPRTGTNVWTSVSSDRSSITEYKRGNHTALYLGMWKNYSKMAPRILTYGQKQRQLHILYDLLNNADIFLAVSLPLMKRGIFNTTWKQNVGAFNGKQKKNHLDRKKAQMPHMQWSCFLSVSLIIRG